jgi:hypothetical protein
MSEDLTRARQLLGVGRAATADEVRAAYMDLVKVWHPDRFGSDLRLREKAERQLRAINEAFALLTGDAEPRPRRAPPASAAPVPRAPPARSDREARPSAAPASTRSGNRSAGAYLGWLAIAILVAVAAFYSSSKPPAATPAVPGPSAAETPTTTGRGRSTGTVLSQFRKTDPGAAPVSSDYWDKLSSVEQQSALQACARAKANDEVYGRCLGEELEDARAVPAPNYVGIEPDKQGSIERACESTKAKGPAAYRDCQNELISVQAKEDAKDANDSALD